MTHDEYIAAFRDGANAMQGRVAAWLMAKRHYNVAPLVLTIPLPEATPPGSLTFDGPADIGLHVPHEQLAEFVKTMNEETIPAIVRAVEAHRPGHEPKPWEEPFPCPHNTDTDEPESKS